MKKLILFASLALLATLLAAQTQDQAQEQPEGEPQVQAQVEPAVQPNAPAAAPDMNLKRVHFPQAFVHAGKEYPAGTYWLTLTTKDDQPLFTVQNDQKETLFEELAVVKERGSGRTGAGFRVNKQMMKDHEYFRVKVTTPGQWLMGYFLTKK